MGLIGPNGAGKSTAFNCIASVYPPTEGEVCLYGEKTNNQKPWDLCRKDLARTFQIVKPFASKSLLYNVLEHGRITMEDGAAELLENPHIKTANLGL